MQFYPADWLKDPDLQICSMNTIGIWINVMCRMWEAKEEGILRGTFGELALLAGARPHEFKRFIKEAKEHNFCDVLQDVTKSYSVVMLKCRRMNKAFLEREGSKFRMRKHRGGSGYEEVTAPSSSSTSSSSSKKNNICQFKGLFNTARTEYPGTVRGLDVEWDYLNGICRKYSLPVEQTVSEISVAVGRLLEWRESALAAGNFVPAPKNFKTWLCNRCWTEEFAKVGGGATGEIKRCYKLGCNAEGPAKWKDDAGLTYFKCKEHGG